MLPGWHNSINGNGGCQWAESMTLTFPVAVTQVPFDRSPQPLNPALPPSMSPELEEHSNISLV